MSPEDGSPSGLEARPRESGYRAAVMPSGPRRHSGLYSQFVVLMKFALPVVAIILIALVVAWPHLKTQDLRFRIGFAALKASEAEDPSMVNPRYLGTDKDNQAYTVTADLARKLSENSANVELEMPKADLALEDGTWLVLTAKQGVYGRGDKILDLQGAVVLYHDSGYEFLTEKAKIDLNTSIAAGNDPVTGQGPFGELQAEGFRLVDKGKTIYFTGKSRVVLYPGIGSALK